MKTIITIEIETKLTPIYRLDGSGLLTDELITEDFEKELHEAIDSEIRNFVECDEFKEEVMSYDFENGVEDYDLGDYGDTIIKVGSQNYCEDKSL